MKIINETRWRTDHLRAFVRRVAQDELDPDRRKRFTVRVNYARRDGTHVGGHAHYHSHEIRLHMPGPEAGIDRADLALTIAHEIAHARGMRHRDMKTPRYSTWVEGWRAHYAWAETLPMQVRVPAPKPDSQARRIIKLDHARRKLAEWERRIKLAQTHRRKWRTRYQRLVRAVGAAAAKPEGDTPCTT